MNIPRGIKYYRGLKKVTQKELAEYLGVNNTNVSNWEKGIARPDIEMIVRISNYFEISVDDLIFPEKKLENFSEKKDTPEIHPRDTPQTKENTPQIDTPKQYDPTDGIMHDFAADHATDQEQIDSLNELVAGLQRACDQKNLLLAAKDELLAAKDQTIATQNNALKLLEGQINATTALIEELTKFLGNGAKKRSELADARNASDVVAP